MRIISGKFKGKQIHAPKGLPVRPTTDYAKTGLFNILNNRIEFETTKVLDLCTGTGSISYELVSRGCENITCVDANLMAVRFVQDTLNQLIPGKARVVRYDVFRFLEICNETYDLIFADPPYELAGIEKIPDLVFEKKLLNEGGMLILEHGENKSFEAHPHFQETRNYGKVNFSFFE